jgi:hypothetical protein
VHIRRDDVPVQIEVAGAVAGLQPGFGSAGGYGPLRAEYFSLPAGTDIAPLLKGLESDMCQAPHWGYMTEGRLTVHYADGQTEEVIAGALFYWPAGHTVEVHLNAELLMFSSCKRTPARTGAYEREHRVAIHRVSDSQRRL